MAADPAAVGRVVDQRGNPVRHAVVTISTSEISVSKLVTREGRFSLSIATARAEVWCNIAAAGYRPRSLRLDRKGNTFIGGTIAMTPIIRIEPLPPSLVNGGDLLLPLAISSDEALVAQGFRLRGALPPGHCSGPSNTLLRFVINETLQIVRKAGQNVTGRVDIEPPTLVQSFKGDVEFNSCSGGMLVLTGQFPIQIAKETSTLNIILPAEFRVEGASTPSTISVVHPARRPASGISLELLVDGGGAIPAGKLFDVSLSLQQTNR